jgi:phosphatidylethanolamine-binding protein (PEBP) family uncharacterized protein
MFKLILLFICSCFFNSVYASNFTLESSSITGSQIEAKYTCDGENISPALNWFNVPNQTKSFVLIMSDPDAPGGTFYHWLVYNIPASTTSLPENAVIATLGQNRFNHFNIDIFTLRKNYAIIFCLFRGSSDCTRE